MIFLTDTSACLMRDELYKAISAKTITKKEITERLYKADIPDWLQAEILQMANYRKYDRITDPVEQAMEAAIHRKIIHQLVNKSK